jgi:long-chain fatty acid transport protein
MRDERERRDWRDERDGQNEGGVQSVHVALFAQVSRFTRHNCEYEERRGLLGNGCQSKIKEVGMLRKWTLAMATVVVILALTEASEAGGLFLTEIGTEDVALAGAGWAARAQDASTLFKNPAGMSLLEGNQFQGGLQALYFQSGGFSGTNTPYGGNGGGNPVGVFPGASAFYVHSLNKDFKVGIGMLSNFGLGEKYQQGYVGRYYVKQATLVGVTFAPVASYRVNEQFSVGGGPNIMVAYMKDTTNINNLLPPGTGDGQVYLTDTTVGVGGQVGVLFEPQKGSRVGVTYYSPIKLNFSTTPTFSNLGTIGTALQNRGVLNRRVDLGITVPQHLMVSGYHELSDAWAVMGDFGWENWSQFGKVDVAVVSATTNSLTTTSKFNDTYHGGIGTQYRLNPESLLNSGFAYDSSMVSDANRPVALPVGATYKFGLGADWLMSQNVKLGFSYELAYGGNVSISQNRGPLAGQVTGEFKNLMTHFFAFTLNWGSQGVTFGPGGSAS